ADRLFFMHNFQHIFQGYRLKEQAVRRVVIGGYGFGVTVNHDGFITVFAHSKRSVHAAIIEFDTLADTIRATTDNQNLLLIAWVSFTLFLIGRVHISSRSGKLGRASIDTLVRRANI